eukprot:jgi/Chlat1/8156/Chrsp76S07610
MDATWRRAGAIAGHVAPVKNATCSSMVRVSDPVRAALDAGQPVVALESTIISHGMPYPDNLTTALEVEDEIRHHGAMPATIAILDGIPRVGLTREELERLARLGPRAHKVSRRDLPYVVSHKLNGATTVSGTMVLAARAGIEVFVTGGIGGVHRGAERTWDVSADLTELARTPVTVVCAGAKSILDIPKTLEYLETQGVPVIGFSTGEFPAFFTPSSGCQVALRVDSPQECAATIRASSQLVLGSGVLVAVPIPHEHAAEGQVVDRAIAMALRESEEAGVQGKDITPFLLKRVNELTGGDSLAANVALVKNNASVGARIAVSLARLSRKEEAPLT